jgi:hypothetical protein
VAEAASDARLAGSLRTDVLALMAVVVVLAIVLPPLAG